MTWFYINLDISPITYTRLKCTCTCNITVFQMALKVLSPRVVFLDTISVVHDSIFLLLSCSPDPVNSVYINHAARQSSFSCSWRLAYKQSNFISGPPGLRPIIHPIYDLLEHMKGGDLGCRSKASESLQHKETTGFRRSPSKDPALIG